MRRRDFLLLRTRDERRVLELSCERLYVRYVDALSGVVHVEATDAADAGSVAWDGEPPMEIEPTTTTQLFDRLDGELTEAHELRILGPEWLTGEFGRQVDARIAAFQRDGGHVVDGPEQGGRASSALRRAVLIWAVVASGASVGSSATAQSPADDAVKARVEAALEAASDLPSDSITVTVSDGVVTLKGSVVCAECGGRRTPGGAATVQQSLGAVVRAVPGVRSVRFELRYRPAGNGRDARRCLP